MLCDAILYYATLCDAILYYATQYYSILFCGMLYYTTLCKTITQFFFNHHFLYKIHPPLQSCQMEHSENLTEMKIVKEPKVQVKRKKMDGETAQRMNRDMLLRKGSVSVREGERERERQREGAVMEGKEQEKKEKEEKEVKVEMKEEEIVSMVSEAQSVQITIEMEDEGRSEYKKEQQTKPEVIQSNTVNLQKPETFIHGNSAETVSTTVDVAITEKSKIEIEFERVSNHDYYLL
jgi:hypothetical protein